MNLHNSTASLSSKVIKTEADHVYLSSPSLHQTGRCGTYKAVTLENAQKTRLEPGVLRFEFFQDAADPAHFSLFEVYADMAARDAHLQTEHFLKWKDIYLATQCRKGEGHEFTAVYPAEGDWKKV